MKGKCVALQSRFYQKHGVQFLTAKTSNGCKFWFERSTVRHGHKGDAGDVPPLGNKVFA